MRTLIVGLDNPNSNDPTHALIPTDGSAGQRMVEMIDAVLPEDYLDRHYMGDFERTNLYPIGAAAEGRGRLARDVEQFANLLYLCGALKVDEVILLGTRVTEAFNHYYGEELKPLECVVTNETAWHDDQPRRFWSLPHPSGRNRWYNNQRNRRLAGKLLSSLRARQFIPYGRKAS